MFPAASAVPAVQSVATPGLWAGVLIAVVGLARARLRHHPPSARGVDEGGGWSAFYIAIPLAFGGYIWSRFGSTTGVEYLTGYLVEKSLSVDNLFVFMLLLSAFAVPVVLQQRVLLYGIVGALVLRGVFIALGAAALDRLSFAFLLIVVVLLATAVKILRDQRSGPHAVDVEQMRSVRLLRRVMPVTSDYRGPRLFVRENGARAATPFALLGLRALYLVLQGALSRLVHLGYGLAAILAFIGVKLVLHWAHGIWAAVPEIPTLVSLGVIMAVLGLVTATSLASTRSEVARR